MKKNLNKKLNRLGRKKRPKLYNDVIVIRLGVLKNQEVNKRERER